jgi:hypothetical protein
LKKLPESRETLETPPVAETLETPIVSSKKLKIERTPLGYSRREEI